MIKRPIFAALLAIVVPVCAAAQQTPPSEPELTLARGLDSAEVVRQLSALPRGEGPAHQWVFRVVYSAAGMAETAAVYWDDPAATEAQQAVGRILVAGARRLPAGTKGDTLTVTAVPGPRAILRTPLERAPRPRNMAQVQAEMVRAAARLAPADPKFRGTQSTVNVRMRVGVDGTPSSIFLVPPTRIAVLDEGATGTAQIMRFHPAMVEGRPAAAWVQIPLVFVVP